MPNKDRKDWYQAAVSLKIEGTERAGQVKEKITVLRTQNTFAFKDLMRSIDALDQATRNLTEDPPSLTLRVTNLLTKIEADQKKATVTLGDLDKSTME